MHCDSLAGLHIQQQTIRQCDYPPPLFFQFLNISLDRVTCATAADVLKQVPVRQGHTLEKGQQQGVISLHWGRGRPPSPLLC
jgi:hypothetical protein